MSSDETVFNTDLFSLNAPELAQQVAEYPVGFRGLDNVRIPYNVAKKLVKRDGHSQLGNLLDEWEHMTMKSINDVKKWNPHYDFIEGLMTANSSYNVFISRFKHFSEELEKNKAQINRVYYGYVTPLGGI